MHQYICLVVLLLTPISAIAGGCCSSGMSVPEAATATNVTTPVAVERVVLEALYAADDDDVTIPALDEPAETEGIVDDIVDLGFPVDELPWMLRDPITVMGAVADEREISFDYVQRVINGRLHHYYGELDGWIPHGRGILSNDLTTWIGTFVRGQQVQRLREINHRNPNLANREEIRFDGTNFGLVFRGLGDIVLRYFDIGQLTNNMVSGLGVRVMVRDDTVTVSAGNFMVGNFMPQAKRAAR